MMDRRVPELVRDHRGQFVFGVREGDQLTRKENMPARDVECVRLRIIDYVKRERQACWRKVLHQLCPDALDVRKKSFVADRAKLTSQPLQSQLTERHFLLGSKHVRRVRISHDRRWGTVLPEGRQSQQDQRHGSKKQLHIIFFP
jgi:hypothetical protein